MSKRNGTLETNNKLLAVLQHYAPDGPSQQKCSELIWEARTNGATHTQIDQVLGGALLDGLRYGNWPWNFPETDQVSPL